MFFIGYFLARYGNFAAYPLSLLNSPYPIFSILIIFIPANNQIFGYIVGSSYIIIVVISLVVGGKIIISKIFLVVIFNVVSHDWFIVMLFGF